MIELSISSICVRSVILYFRCKGTEISLYVVDGKLEIIEANISTDLKK